MPIAALDYLDSDDNVQVSQEEFSKQMDAFFEPMDTNRSGQLEFGEVENFMERGIFDQTDTNRNGSVSSSEYKAQILRDFSNADIDGDGVLDQIPALSG